MTQTDTPQQLPATRQQEAQVLPAPITFCDMSILLDVAKFEHLQRVATLFSKSTLLPAQYRGNLADCFIALQISMRLGIEPFMFMQSSYVVHGKPGLEAKLVIALVNTRGPYVSGLHFEHSGSGDSRACRAYGIRRDTGVINEATVDMRLAKAEGWLDKPGSKWKTMPDQMLAYRAAAFLARLYCPEVIMGMQTTEELRDIGEQDGRQQQATALNALLSAPPQETAASAEPPEKPKKKSRYLSEQPGWAEAEAKRLAEANNLTNQNEGNV